MLTKCGEITHNYNFLRSLVALWLHEHPCVVFVRTRCIIDEKICVSQRKITKTVIALGKKQKKKKKKKNKKNKKKKTKTKQKKRI